MTKIRAREFNLLILAVLCAAAAPSPARAQQPVPAERLTIQRAVALAVQNSRELALARVRANSADKTAGVSRSLFLPNLYTGSGAAYTHGFPQSSIGRAPNIFEISYSQSLLNMPLRGEVRSAQERAQAEHLSVDATRDSVILTAASGYLELSKVRHSLDLLRRERESAQRIQDVTRERLAAGLELPIESTRAQLSAARIEQRILELEGREDALEARLRDLMGLPADQHLELATDELPLAVDEKVGDLIDSALANNTDIKRAEAERRAREETLRGERGGRLPKVDIIGLYSLLSRYNNYDKFYNSFQRNSVSAGVNIELPIYSARTSATVALAQSEASAAELELKSKRAEIELDVRRQARHARELDAAREVARLELQLAQQNLAILQAEFDQGRSSLRDLEKARLEESDRWLAWIDAGFQRQSAQLELLRLTGQLAKLFP